jgi:hypothetical protein
MAKVLHLGRTAKLFPSFIVFSLALWSSTVPEQTIPGVVFGYNTLGEGVIDVNNLL